MMPPKVSFILPCYNVGRYITDCLDSLYAQGLAEDEFEVIAVNDCSTDGTRATLVEYAGRHSNLSVIDHMENLTAGGARNTGIQAAKGEYIWFVDPDDAILPGAAPEAYALAVEKQADILFFNYFDCDEKLESRRRDDHYPDSEVLGGQEYARKYFPGRLATFGIIWRALFRTAFLKEKDLRYPIMRKAQDVVFLWNALLQADRVCSVSQAYYLYRNNPYSVMKHQLEAKVAFSDRVLRGYEIVRMITRPEADDFLPEIREEMMKAILWTANSNLEVLSQMSAKEIENYYTEICLHKNAVQGLFPYMNRKSKLLFDTSLGRKYWILKARLLNRWETKRKQG